MSTAAAEIATHIPLIDATLERLGRERAADPQLLDSGRNHNYRVETPDGPLCVRIHRHTRARERIELGLAALQHALARGIPVAAPLASRGDVLFEVGGRFTSAYAWVEARSHERFALQREDAGTFGAVHGRLMRAMRDFQHAALKPATELWWDTRRSLEQLAQIEAALERQGVEGFDVEELQEDIRRQRGHLQSGTLPPPSDFEHVQRQPIHGDVHEGNVLFARDGSVAAVIDWDMVAAGPPLYEVLRAVDFAHVLDDPAALDDYLGAFAAESPYSSSDAKAMVELWASSTIHNTWSLRTLVLEGDRRVNPFIAAHRGRIAMFSDPAYGEWLTSRLVAFAS